MTWQDVVEHPSLQDLPFKIELNEWGQIVMSPASNQHGRRQTRLARMLMEHLDGEAFVEASIETPKGVKVADVVWMSDTFASTYGDETPFKRAPEICIEVMSPSNSGVEMLEKVLLYLAKGAHEVWLCATDGRLTFHDHTGSRTTSALLPDFPTQID
ncbi:MAG: Uma2 family endonuclease [Rhodothermales bacterium]